MILQRLLKMIKRISFNEDDIQTVNDGSFENITILGIKSGDAEALKQQVHSLFLAIHL